VGGTGVWGNQVMSAHPNESTEDIRSMVDYILSLDAEEEAKLGDAPDAGNKPVASFEGMKEDEKNKFYPGAMVRVYIENKALEKTADVNYNRQPNFAGVMPQLHATDTDMNGLESNFGMIAQGYFYAPKDGV